MRAPRRFTLSKKRGKWVRTYKPSVTLKGKPLNYPAVVEVKYARAVRVIVEDVMREAEKTIKSIFATPLAQEFYAEDVSFASQANAKLKKMMDRLTRQAETRGRKAAVGMTTAINAESARAVASSLKELSGGVTLDPSKLGGAIPDLLHASIAENVSLITGMSDDYLRKITGAVNRSIMEGRGVADLIPYLRKQHGMTARRAKNVALDQTRKAYSSLNTVRMKQVGITHFEWLHSGGGQQPRKFHIDRYPEGLNGGIYELANPPVIDKKTGERGMPATLPFCKCRSIPVLVLNHGEPDE